MPATKVRRWKLFGQPQGLAPEAQLDTASQRAMPDDSRQNLRITNRSGTFTNKAG